MEVCILAGGLSSRMGRDKSKLRLGGKSLLARIRRTALDSGFRVRVVRQDIVERCGPLGGIITALKTTRAAAVLFLACDMPLVSRSLLRKLAEGDAKPIFTFQKNRAGFPFLLPKTILPLVAQLIAEKDFSLQTLAAKSGAEFFQPGNDLKRALWNVNTPEEWARLREKFSEQN